MSTGAVLALAMMGLGALLTAVAMVEAVRRLIAAAGRPTPAASVPPGRRWRTIRQVRGGEPVTVEEIPTVRAMALRVTDHRYLGVLTAGIAVSTVGLALIPIYPLVLSVALVVVATLEAVGAGLTLDHARRARRFLETHPVGRSSSR